MAIILDYSPEIITLINYLKRTGVPFRVTSTIRWGAVTASGNKSYHSRGTAVDFGGPTPGWDSQDMADIFNAFVPIEKHLAELIYAGPQVSYNIKNGQRVPKYAQSIHHNHVHVAIKPGVNLDAFGPQAKEHAPEGPAVTPEEVKERTDKPVAQVIHRPQGGYVVLQTKDGGVFDYGAGFHGSLVGQGSGPAAGLAFTPSGNGYWIVQEDGAVFSYGDAEYKGGMNTDEMKPHLGPRLIVGIEAKGNGYEIVTFDPSNDGSPYDSYAFGV
jgi:hypothetical protein